MLMLLVFPLEIAPAAPIDEKLALAQVSKPLQEPMLIDSGTSLGLFDIDVSINCN